MNRGDRSQERRQGQGQGQGRGQFEREDYGRGRERGREGSGRYYESQRQPQQGSYGRERDEERWSGDERRRGGIQGYGDEERPQRFREQGYGEYGREGGRRGQGWEQQGSQQGQYGGSMGRQDRWSEQGWDPDYEREGRGFGRFGSEREGYGSRRFSERERFGGYGQFQQGEAGAQQRDFDYGREAAQHYGLGREGYGREGSQQHFGVGRRGFDYEREEDEQQGLLGGLRRMFTGRGPKGYQRSDERIREDVCEMLTQAPDVDASEIEIAVSSGEVTITGCVDDRQAKRRAEDIAECAPGVKQVHNQLRVESQENRGFGQQYQQGQSRQGEQSQGRQSDERGKPTRAH